MWGCYPVDAGHHNDLLIDLVFECFKEPIMQLDQGWPSMCERGEKERSQSGLEVKERMREKRTPPKKNDMTRT